MQSRLQPTAEFKELILRRLRKVSPTSIVERTLLGDSGLSAAITIGYDSSGRVIGPSGSMSGGVETEARRS